MPNSTHNSENQTLANQLSNANTTTTTSQGFQSDGRIFLLPDFEIGESVLCPSIDPITTETTPNKHNSHITVKIHREGDSYILGYDDGKLLYYITDTKGECHYFYNDGKENRNGSLPAIFHDTPANRQAISTLYGISYEGLDQPQTQEQAPHALTHNKLAMNGSDFDNLSNIYSQQLNALNHAISTLATGETGKTIKTTRTIAYLSELSDFLTDLLDGEVSDYKDQCNQISTPSQSNAKTKKGDNQQSHNKAMTEDNNTTENIVIPANEAYSNIQDLMVSYENMVDIARLLGVISRCDSLISTHALARLGQEICESGSDWIRHDINRTNARLAKTSKGAIITDNMLEGKL